MSHVVSAGNAKKASETREPRSEYDGKDAKLGYDSDEPAPGSTMAPSGDGKSGDCDFRVSKWNGDGQAARK